MSNALIYTVNIAILIAMALYFYRKYHDNELRVHFFPALILRQVCGILMGLLFYIYYGQGDTIRFYQQATDLVQLDEGKFLETITREVGWTEPMRAIYFVRLVAIIKYFTKADYWLLSVYFSLYSFLGAYYLVDKLSACLAQFKTPAIIGLLYFPSMVFWSSGLLKESLAFGSLCILIGIYFSWRQDGFLKTPEALFGVFSFLFLVFVKYYVAAAIVPPLLYLICFYLPLWQQTKINGLWTKSIIIVLLLIIPFLIFFAWLNPNLTYDRFWQILAESHAIYRQLSPHGSIQLLNWFDNELDILINLPYLFFSGVFRPIIWENTDFPEFFSGVENLFVLVGALFASIFHFKKTNPVTPEGLAALVYVVVLSVMLSYAAPNFGTLARFKIYYMPFVIIFIVYHVKSLQIFRKN